jgi:hypothetical protein
LLSTIFSIALYLYRKNNHLYHRKPTIYVDASWILRSCTTEDRVGYLVRLCSYLVSSGFNVVIVCDGSVRHHSKRSTIKRTSELYNSRIILHRNNTFMMNLLNKKKETDSIEELNHLEGAIKLVGTKITTLQNKLKKSNIDVGDETYKKY